MGQLVSFAKPVDSLYQNMIGPWVARDTVRLVIAVGISVQRSMVISVHEASPSIYVQKYDLFRAATSSMQISI